MKFIDFIKVAIPTELEFDVNIYGFDYQFPTFCMDKDFKITDAFTEKYGDIIQSNVVAIYSLNNVVTLDIDYPCEKHRTFEKFAYDWAGYINDDEYNRLFFGKE